MNYPIGSGQYDDATNLTVITMHQPWASLLVYGIKRIEGRVWPAVFRGRLWIHAAAQEPEPAAIVQLEAWYREVHDMDARDAGVEPPPAIHFPEAYPTGVLLGSVEVVAVAPNEDVLAIPGLPDSLRMEASSPYCWLCQRPRRCVVLQPMLGQPKLWKLPKAAAKMAGRGLKDVQAPSMAAFLAPVHQAGKAGSTSSGQPRTALLGLADGDGWVFTWDPWVSRTGKLLQPAASSSRPAGKSSKAAGAASSPNKLVDASGKSSVGSGDPSNCSVQVVSAAGVSGSSSAVLQTNDAAGVEKRLKAVRKKIRQAEELGRVASTQLQGAGASSSSAIGLSAEQQRKLESLPVLRQEAEDLAVLLAALNT